MSVEKKEAYMGKKRAKYEKLISDQKEKIFERLRNNRIKRLENSTPEKLEQDRLLKNFKEQQRRLEIKLSKTNQ